jgi:hypothetical protein
MVQGRSKGGWKMMHLEQQKEHQILKDATPEQVEEYEERAAILEYHNGLTRKAAEKLAFEIVRGRYA